MDLLAYLANARNSTIQNIMSEWILILFAQKLFNNLLVIFMFFHLTLNFKVSIKSFALKNEDTGMLEGVCAGCVSAYLFSGSGVVMARVT